MPKGSFFHRLAETPIPTNALRSLIEKGETPMQQIIEEGLEIEIEDWRKALQIIFDEQAKDSETITLTSFAKRIRESGEYIDNPVLLRLVENHVYYYGILFHSEQGTIKRKDLGPIELVLLVAGVNQEINDLLNPEKN